MGCCSGFWLIGPGQSNPRTSTTARKKGFKKLYKYQKKNNWLMFGSETLIFVLQVYKLSKKGVESIGKEVHVKKRC